MQPPHSSPARIRLIALALAASVLIVAVLWRLGLPDTIAYGVAGGLIACLLIVGLDRLHSAERRLGERDNSSDRRSPHEDGH